MYIWRGKMNEKIKEIEESLQHPMFIKEPRKHLQSGQARDDIKYLLSKIKKLEELTKDIGSDKALSEVLYEYHERADKAEARIKDLTEGIEKQIRPNCPCSLCEYWRKLVGKE
jgi:protein subunit release factor A